MKVKDNTGYSSDYAVSPVFNIQNNPVWDWTQFFDAGIILSSMFQTTDTYSIDGDIIFTYLRGPVPPLATMIADNVTQLSSGTCSQSLENGEWFASRYFPMDNNHYLGLSTMCVKRINTGELLEVRNIVWSEMSMGPMTMTFDVAGILPAVLPRDFSGLAIAQQKIKLSWTPSPTEMASQYNIYWDSGTGTVDYNNILASVLAPTTLYITESLSTGTYKFALRVKHSFEEINTNLVVSVTVEDSLPNVRALIINPRAGSKLNGNRVTVLARIAGGVSSGDVREVLFQYKSTASSTWSDIDSANINHSNPDENFPYFIHWDVTSLDEGDYNLRAVAKNREDIQDNFAPSITVTVDQSNPDIYENISASVHERREKIYNTVDSAVEVGSADSNAVTRINISSGAVNFSTDTLKIVVNPLSVPAVPNHLASADIFSDITLQSGQTQFSNSLTADISISYSDKDNNGFIDGTLTRADKLNIYVYDGSLGIWKKESESSVDEENKVVTVQTSHFSLFGLFAPCASDLSNILVYPVPWVPGDGNIDNGKPYNSSDSDSGIIFDNLTQSIDIKIYTINGELVWKKITDSTSAKIQWDAKNTSGRDVASGVYFAVIKSPNTGEKAVRKVAIIR